MKRLILLAVLCAVQIFAFAQDQSRFSSLTMNWTHVKNCMMDVLPDNELAGRVTSADVLQCETADRDFTKLIAETYPQTDIKEMDRNVFLAAASRVYMRESGQYVYYEQLDLDSKIDILEFCRETCQILNTANP